MDRQRKLPVILYSYVMDVDSSNNCVNIGWLTTMGCCSFVCGDEVIVQCVNIGWLTTMGCCPFVCGDEVIVQCVNIRWTNYYGIKSIQWWGWRHNSKCIHHIKWTNLYGIWSIHLWGWRNDNNIEFLTYLSLLKRKLLIEKEIWIAQNQEHKFY